MNRGGSPSGVRDDVPGLEERYRPSEPLRFDSRCRMILPGAGNERRPGEPPWFNPRCSTMSSVPRRGCRLGEPPRIIEENRNARGGAGRNASRPGPPGSSERICADGSGKLDGAPVSIPPSPSSAPWTGLRCAVRSLRPGGASSDVKPVGQSSRAGQGGYASSRTAKTLDRGPMSSARAPDFAAHPWSPPARPRSPLAGWHLERYLQLQPRRCREPRQHFRGEVHWNWLESSPTGSPRHPSLPRPSAKRWSERLFQ